MNIYLISFTMAIALGILSRRFGKAFKILLILALPALWLFAYFAPTYLNLQRANQDGFLNFYLKIYERLSPEAMLAVLLFPVFFIAGRFLHLVYQTYFYREKVEGGLEIKKRVLANFGR